MVLPIRLDRRRKRKSRDSCGQKKFDHGGARRSGIAGISSDPGARKQDARRLIELPNSGKKVHLTQLCEKAFFQHLVIAGNENTIRPNQTTDVEELLLCVENIRVLDLIRKPKNYQLFHNFALLYPEKKSVL